MRGHIDVGHRPGAGYATVTIASDHQRQPRPEITKDSPNFAVRHEAPYNRVGWKDPPVACRSRPLKLEAA
jgi:hypothetical protein